MISCSSSSLFCSSSSASWDDAGLFFWLGLYTDFFAEIQKSTRQGGIAAKRHVVQSRIRVVVKTKTTDTKKNAGDLSSVRDKDTLKMNNIIEHCWDSQRILHGKTSKDITAH